MWLGLVLIGMSCTLILVAAYVGQRSWQKRNAAINAQACQPGGERDGGTFTTCALDVTYTDPSGRFGTAHLVGVASNRIHDDTVDVYVSDATSHLSINPEQRTPASVFALIIAGVWFIVAAVCVIVAVVSRRTPRPSH